MITALALAVRLHHASDRELVSLIDAREILSADISDFFDLAEALLASESIQCALSHLDRYTLATIAAARSPESGGTNRLPAVLKRLSALRSQMPPNSAEVRHHIDTAHRLMLLDINDDGDITVYAAVSERLDAWPSEGLPNVAVLATEPQPAVLAPVRHTVTPSDEGEAVEHSTIERAFTTVTAITEILSELSRTPAKELSKGGLALPDAKRLASATTVTLEEIEPLMSIASRAGLILLDGNYWVTSATASTWLTHSFAGRWRKLAESWLVTLPDDIRKMLTHLAEAEWDFPLFELVRWLYPAGGKWMMDRITIHTRDINMLGIAIASSQSHLGHLMLTKGMNAAQTAVEKTFPPTVDKIYIQNDFSAISTGPLEAPLDARLRIIADVEARGLASTYRFSASSLTRALRGGESAASILPFLETVSVTGVPQAVRYLVEETASRYGLIRIGNLPHSPPHLRTTFHSYIRSQDSSLLRAIEVDRTLAHLSLRRVDDRLLSRHSLDTVYWALTDARYPVAAETSEQKIMSLETTHPQQTTPEPKRSDAELLVERLRTAEIPEETEQAWLIRQIHIAIRNKTSLIVSVSMPNGSVADFLLEPTNISRGRLRARDHNTDIERTLPLTSIHQVTFPDNHTSPPTEEQL